MSTLEELLRRCRSVERDAVDVPAVEGMLQELTLALTGTPGLRRELGPWIGRLREARARLASGDAVLWFPLGCGALAIGHRPAAKQLQWLERRGATHVWTLLAESEGAREVQAAAERAGLAWLWLPMETAAPPGVERDPEFHQAFEHVAALLEQGARVFLHCSAGIHRTGMVALAFLRSLGLGPAEALQSLSALRTLTAAQLDAPRRAWGDRFGANREYKENEWGVGRTGPVDSHTSRGESNVPS